MAPSSGLVIGQALAVEHVVLLAAGGRRRPSGSHSSSIRSSVRSEPPAVAVQAYDACSADDHPRAEARERDAAGVVAAAVQLHLEQQLAARCTTTADRRPAPGGRCRVALAGRARGSSTPRAARSAGRGGVDRVVGQRRRRPGRPRSSRSGSSSGRRRRTAGTGTWRDAARWRLDHRRPCRSRNTASPTFGSEPGRSSVLERGGVADLVAAARHRRCRPPRRRRPARRPASSGATCRPRAWSSGGKALRSSQAFMPSTKASIAATILRTLGTGRRGGLVEALQEFGVGVVDVGDARRSCRWPPRCCRTTAPSRWCRRGPRSRPISAINSRASATAQPAPNATSTRPCRPRPAARRRRPTRCGRPRSGARSAPLGWCRARPA